MRLHFATIAFLACLFSPVFAEETPPAGASQTQNPAPSKDPAESKADARKVEYEAAVTAAEKAAVRGPKDIRLGEEGVFRLPEGT